MASSLANGYFSVVVELNTHAQYVHRVRMNID